jgi:DNA polymerase-3 subunit gamma/tau
VLPPSRPRSAVLASRPAVAEPAPALRVLTGAGEPPPWMDAPFEDEVIERPAQRLAPKSTAPRAAEPSSIAVVAGAAPAAPNPSPLAPSALGQRWADLVRQMNDAGLISAFARELAMQAQCVALDEQAAGLVCRLRVERETLRASAHCDKLQAALADVLQRSVRLEVDTGATEDSPSKRDAAERARRQIEAEQIIHDDPLVQALMAQYKTARIVPGSVKPH